jgi:cytochrome oxidase assembly protein ShyY1
VISLLGTRRWLAFSALVIGVVIAFGVLSQWQWHRAQEREFQRRDLLAHTDGPTQSVDAMVNLPVEDLQTLQWQPLDITGIYESSQLAVRRRPLDGRNGFWVLSRMTTDSGGVWINRGWVPAAGDAMAVPKLPVPPAGEVTIRGYYRSPEVTDSRQWQGMPPGMIPAIAPTLLGAPSALPGYVQLASSDPPQQGLVVLPLPEIDPSRNISYAVQWILFALVAVGGWFFMLRRESRAERTQGDR